MKLPKWYTEAKATGKITQTNTNSMSFSFRDYLWVAIAYLRGKVLRQQAYRPQSQGNYMVFRTALGATYKRQALLVKLWGGRLMTVESVLAMVGDTIVNEDDSDDKSDCRVPTEDWGG